MKVTTLHQPLKAFLALALFVSSVLPAAGQTSPEQFGGAGGQGSTPSCNSCCTVEQLNCSNPAVKTYINDNLDSCVGCSDKLKAQARGCGMIPSNECPACPACANCPNPPACPPPPVCPKSCPITKCAAGEQLWSPDSPACVCLKTQDVCNQIGDLTKIGINAYHPTTEPNKNFITAFDNGAGTGLTTSEALSKVSPCMEQARLVCAKKAENQKLGFYSYRMPEVKRFALSATDSAAVATNETLYRERLKYLDSCIAATLQNRYSMADPAYQQGSITMNGVSTHSWRGTALLYKDCRPVEPWKQKAIDDAQCSVALSANFNEYTSPVSLLWAADVTIREVASRSKFPLNPKDAGKWFVWRGSGLTPLVVWDPAKKGVIISAEQLFGTHTWGKEWKHGYEPLSSLDKDTNGWLEGEELKDLALWFDFNQDGISDKGEVKQLNDVAVTALGVKVTATDDKNGEVHAAQGFRRTVKGAVVEGASVDWFSGAEDGRFGMEALDENVLQVAKTIGQDKNSSAANFDPLDEVSGLWDWRVVDKDSEELPENMPHGTIVLYSTNKEVAGTVYVTDQFAPNKSGIGERVSYRPIAGVAKPGERGRAQVSFSTTSPAGGVVESVAQLSEDGMYLAGITTEPQGQGKAPLKYGWVARRASLQK